MGLANCHDHQHIPPSHINTLHKHTHRFKPAVNTTNLRVGFGRSSTLSAINLQHLVPTLHSISLLCVCCRHATSTHKSFRILHCFGFSVHWCAVLLCVCEPDRLRVWCVFNRFVWKFVQSSCMLPIYHTVVSNTSCNHLVC